MRFVGSGNSINVLYEDRIVTYVFKDLLEVFHELLINPIGETLDWQAPSAVVSFLRRVLMDER